MTVWSANHGWMLVNTINHTLMLSNGQTIPFSDAQKLFTLPQLFSEPSLPSGKPLILSYLILSEIQQFTQIWLEPISPDSDLRTELRGWYQVKNITFKMSMETGFI